MDMDSNQKEHFSKLLHSAILQALQGGEALRAAIAEIRSAGYDVRMGVEVNIFEKKFRTSEKRKEPESLVKDGKVVPDAFSERDREAFQRMFRIKLE